MSEGSALQKERSDSVAGRVNVGTSMKEIRSSLPTVKYLTIGFLILRYSITASSLSVDADASFLVTNSSDGMWMLIELMMLPTSDLTRSCLGK